jgi:hypothetical protein
MFPVGKIGDTVRLCIPDMHQGRGESQNMLTDFRS